MGSKPSKDAPRQHGNGRGQIFGNRNSFNGWQQQPFYQQQQFQQQQFQQQQFQQQQQSCQQAFQSQPQQL
ncbi:hypothetical protein BGX27_003482, partial [Mortierella sp. AM989]